MERKVLKYGLELEKARSDKQAAISFINYLMGQVIMKNIIKNIKENYKLVLGSTDSRTISWLAIFPPVERQKEP